jgi:hypothetical protein
MPVSYARGADPCRSGGDDSSHSAAAPGRRAGPPRDRRRQSGEPAAHSRQRAVERDRCAAGTGREPEARGDRSGRRDHFTDSGGRAAGAPGGVGRHSTRDGVGRESPAAWDRHTLRCPMDHGRSSERLSYRGLRWLCQSRGSACSFSRQKDCNPNLAAERRAARRGPYGIVSWLLRLRWYLFC